MEKLLRVKQAADLLCISKSGLYSLVAQHTVPHLRIGSRVLFREQDLEKWVEEQKVEVEMFSWGNGKCRHQKKIHEAVNKVGS